MVSLAGHQACTIIGLRIRIKMGGSVLSSQCRPGSTQTALGSILALVVVEDLVFRVATTERDLSELRLLDHLLQIGLFAFLCHATEVLDVGDLLPWCLVQVKVLRVVSGQEPPVPI